MLLPQRLRQSWIFKVQEILYFYIIFWIDMERFILLDDVFKEK